MAEPLFGNGNGTVPSWWSLVVGLACQTHNRHPESEAGQGEPRARDGRAGMKKVGCVVVAALVLLLGVGGGIAYLRGFDPSLPSLRLGQQTADDTATATSVTETAPMAEAEESGSETVTIYGAVCPTDYAGEDYFDDCYDTPAAGAGYTLAIGGIRIPASGLAVAGEDGLIAPSDSGGMTSGVVILQAIAPDAVIGSGGFQVPAAACTADDGQTVALTPQESQGVGQLFAFDLRAGDDLRCDVYFVPLTAGGEKASLGAGIDIPAGPH